MSKTREDKSIDIYRLADKLLKEIEPQVKAIMVVGSVARKEKDANDLDFLIIPQDKTEIKLKDSVGVNWAGDKKIQHVLNNKVTIDLLFTTPQEWGAAVLHFMGPKGYDIGLKMRAKKMGFKLNEYGLFNRTTNELIARETEKEILTALGKEWKPYEAR